MNKHQARSDLLDAITKYRLADREGEATATFNAVITRLDAYVAALADDFTAHDMADQGAKQFAAGERASRGAQPDRRSALSALLYAVNAAAAAARGGATGEDKKESGEAYEAAEKAILALAGGAQPVGITDEQIEAVMKLVLEYGNHFFEALEHKSSSRADVSHAAALKTLGAIRRALTTTSTGDDAAHDHERRELGEIESVYQRFVVNDDGSKTGPKR